MSDHNVTKNLELVAAAASPMDNAAKANLRGIFREASMGMQNSAESVNAQNLSLIAAIANNAEDEQLRGRAINRFNYFTRHGDMHGTEKAFLNALDKGISDSSKDVRKESMNALQSIAYMQPALKNEVAAIIAKTFSSGDPDIADYGYRVLFGLGERNGMKPDVTRIFESVLKNDTYQGPEKATIDGYLSSTLSDWANPNYKPPMRLPPY